MPITDDESTTVEYLKWTTRTGLADVYTLRRDTAERVFTEERMRLLEGITANEPDSVRDLAWRVDRNVSIVSRDLKVLYDHLGHGNEHNPMGRWVGSERRGNRERKRHLMGALPMPFVTPHASPSWSTHTHSQSAGSRPLPVSVVPAKIATECEPRSRRFLYIQTEPHRSGFGAARTRARRTTLMGLSELPISVLQKRTPCTSRNLRFSYLQTNPHGTGFGVFASSVLTLYCTSRVIVHPLYSYFRSLAHIVFYPHSRPLPKRLQSQSTGRWRSEAEVLPSNRFTRHRWTTSLIVLKNAIP